MSLTSTEYNNRDLSWLRFNHRVLQEAADMRNPLCERIKFLAIFSSNLDQFFKVRVAAMHQQLRTYVQWQLDDTVKGRIIDAKQKNSYVPQDELAIHSQEKAYAEVLKMNS